LLEVGRGSCLIGWVTAWYVDLSCAGDVYAQESKKKVWFVSAQNTHILCLLKKRLSE
jgi:hypothetical protein